MNIISCYNSVKQIRHIKKSEDNTFGMTIKVTNLLLPRLITEQREKVRKVLTNTDHHTPALTHYE